MEARAVLTRVVLSERGRTRGVGRQGGPQSTMVLGGRLFVWLPVRIHSTETPPGELVSVCDRSAPQPAPPARPAARPSIIKERAYEYCGLVSGAFCRPRRA